MRKVNAQVVLETRLQPLVHACWNRLWEETMGVKCLRDQDRLRVRLVLVPLLAFVHIPETQREKDSSSASCWRLQDGVKMDPMMWMEVPSLAN